MIHVYEDETFVYGNHWISCIELNITVPLST